MKKILISGLVISFILAACSVVSPQVETDDDQLITIYALDS